MATVTGLLLEKRFTYRGNNDEIFGNKYWFKNVPPGNDASWEVLAFDLLDVEQRIFPPTVTFVSARGYDSNDPHAHHVFQKNFEVPGPAPTGIYSHDPLTEDAMAGDQAAMVEWPTDKIGGRGKRIYLRKYFHAGWVGSNGGDALSTPYGDALVLYSNQVTLLHGGLRSQVNDLNTVASSVSPWVTTRTLKRRGKKKKTS